MKIQFTNPSYDREKLKAGIAHIGVGNFHRAHQAYLIDSILKMPGNENWAICGIGLLEKDREILERMKSQNYLYSLTEFSFDNKHKSHVIGSIIEYLHALDEKEKVIEKLADPYIKIISFTITEGGYNIDKASGEFIFSSPLIQEDLANPKNPKTLFGILLEGLNRRYERNEQPPTLLSCDNLKNNGSILKRALLAFSKKINPKTAKWIEDHVSFPNSMVDRIVPFVEEKKIHFLNKLNELEDKTPVFSEDFIQWVIEDHFSSGRPPLEKVGVVFSDKVNLYENAKIYLLNATHSMIAYPAWLCGYKNMDEVIENPLFKKYAQEFLDEIASVIHLPENFDVENYKSTLLKRFSNKAIRDQIDRLAMDGASKIPTFILPSLKKFFKKGEDNKKISFLMAAYGEYLSLCNDFSKEPYLSKIDREKAKDIEDFLDTTIFRALNLKKENNFYASYKQNRIDIQKGDILEVLKNTLA